MYMLQPRHQASVQPQPSFNNSNEVTVSRPRPGKIPCSPGYGTLTRLKLVARSILCLLVEDCGPSTSSAPSQEDLDEAFQIKDPMAHHGAALSASMLYRMLEGCIKRKDLDGGKQVHALIVRSRLQSNPFLGNHLIRFYALFGKLLEVKKVFIQLPVPDNFVWAAIISAYGNHGRPEQAIQLYHQMQDASGKPDDYVFVAALKACANAAALPAGKLIHAHIQNSGAESHLFVGNTLVDMYAKCGSLQDARIVFDKLPQRDLVTWNAMIAGYAQHGAGQEAFKLFQKMHEEGMQPDKMTLASILKACSGVAAKEQGQLIHSQINLLGLESDVFVGSSLIDMYSKCGSLEDARKVFDGLRTKDLVTWTAMIAGYAQQGDGQAAIDLLHKMQGDGIQPNQLTLASILKACSSIAALDQGKLLHSQIMESGFDSNIHIGSTLIDMYSKCGNLEDAREVFDTMLTKNLVTWTAMISGYSLNGHGHDALDLFHRMQLEGTLPNQLTLVSTLKACSSVGSLDHGRLLHAQIMHSGFESNVFIGSTLIDMYARCGSLEDAQCVFESLPRKSNMLCSALIAGYAHHEGGMEALQLFHKMQYEGIEADKVMLFSVLKACSTVAALDQGKLLHGQIVSGGLESDVFIGSTLVDFYVKCGNLREAHLVFDRLPNRDLVTWTALIAGYAHYGDGQEALNLFQQMQDNGMQPNEVTLVSLLKACSTIPALNQGRLLHGRIINELFESDVFVGSALVDMYAKCGSLEDAHRVFDRMPAKDLVSWNAMITGCSQHGFAQVALQLFEQMQREGMQPDNVTFIELLSACSHAGLLEESSTVFQSMSREFAITPEMEHYVCMVDVLGRSGRLYAGYEFICQMTLQPDVIVWMSLLGACRTRGDVALGRQVFEAILALDPSNTAAHVLMGELYLEAGMWESKAEIRKKMQGICVRKDPGRTWIESATELHTFGVDDKAHPDRKHIYATIDMLTRQIRHVSRRESAPIPGLHDVDEEMDEDPTCVSVERLALALSFLKLPIEKGICL